MANKNKLTTKPKSAPPQPPPSAPLVTTTTDTPTRRDVRRIAKHLASSAVEAALQYIWVVVGGAVLTTVTAVWLAITSGNPLVTHLAAYAAGWFSVVLLILFLAWRKSRRLEALEQAKNLKFVSQEKGFLDHAVNKDKAFKQFTATTLDMANEIAKIGNATSKATARIEIAKRFSGERAAKALHRIASQTAAKLSKHSINMEQQLARFDKATDLLVESTVGFYKWFTPNTEQDKQQLINDRAGLNTLIEATRSSVVSTEGFRDSQNSLKGISQELNTTINRLVSVTDGVIVSLRRSITHWEKLAKLIDEKLNA